MTCKLTFRQGVEKMIPYQPGKPAEDVERELGIKQAVKLASNENPYGPSPLVKKRLKEAMAKLAVYPDGSCHAFRQRLSRKLKCRPNQLILGNGSNELLVHLGMALLNKGDHVVTSQMSFVVYAKVAQLMQARLTSVPMRDFTFDLDGLLKAITPKTKLIFIANPNNPTGTALAPDALYAFIRKVPAHVLVVLDEAYYEYADPRYQSASLKWVHQFSHVAVLRTFSKAYGLAGLRLGYGVVSPEVALAVERVREPFNVNSLAQVAGLATLEDEAHMRQCVAVAKKERQRVTGIMKTWGLAVAPSQTNFLFVDLSSSLSKKSWTGQALFEALMQSGVIVRPIPGPFVRITLGTPKENDRLLAAMAKLIN